MSTDYRDALQELHTSIQLYTGQNPAAADVHPAELTRRLMDAMAASAAALAKSEPVARPEDEYHEDMGAVLWWRFPIDEPPYCGSPLDSEWPGYHTHFTPLGPMPIPANNTKEES